MLIKYNPKHQIKVGGKMSIKGADRAGLILAISVFIFSVLVGTGILLVGLGYFLK